MLLCKSHSLKSKTVRCIEGRVTCFSRWFPIAASRGLLGHFHISKEQRQEYEALVGHTGSGLKKRVRVLYSPAKYSFQDDVVAVICVIFHCVQNKTYFILEVLNHLITNQYVDACGTLFKDLVYLSR